jgi:hypothetical protein
MRKTLRLLLILLGISAVLIACSILFLGASVTAALGERVFDLAAARRPEISAPWPPTMDNELRFYAVLWGAYGVLLLVTARDLGARLEWVPWLALVFFVGGLGRVVSWVSVGTPHPFFLFLMCVELALPPVLIILWLALKRPTRNRTS